MKGPDLQDTFIEELKELLHGWKFIKSERHFKKSKNDFVWYFSISCINHDSDFDAVGDIAIEFRASKERICIVGAELGNIAGIGQKRFPVSSQNQAKESALAIFNYFEDFGMPFLKRFSEPSEVLAVLKSGGKEAMLISPLLNQHENQINLLSSYFEISM